jgi:hypothetical protein
MLKTCEYGPTSEWLNMSYKGFFDYGEDRGVLLVDEEMISLQHVQLAVACCLFAPGFEFVAWSCFVLQPTQHRDGALQWFTGNIVVVVTQFEVSSEHGRQYFHQLLVLEYLSRCSIHLFEFRKKFRIRQIVNIWIAHGYSRRSSSGDDQMRGLDVMLRTQAACKFKTDDRAHAVTKKRERLIEEWSDLTRERLDERLDMCVRRFSQFQFSSRQQCRNELNFARKIPAPLPEDRAAASGVWETEKPDACGGTRLHLKPRVWSSWLEVRLTHDDQDCAAAAIFFLRLSGRMSVQTSLM